MLALQEYDSDNSDQDDDNPTDKDDLNAHLKPVNKENSIVQKITLNAAPDVVTKVRFLTFKIVIWPLLDS